MHPSSALTWYVNKGLRSEYCRTRSVFKCYRNSDVVINHICTSVFCNNYRHLKHLVNQIKHVFNNNVDTVSLYNKYII